MFESLPQQQSTTLSIQSIDQQPETILERIADAIFVLDSAWKFLYLNKQAERILGKNRTELLQKNIWEIFPTTIDSALYPRYHEAMHTGNPVHFEIFYPPLGWFQISAYPSQDQLVVHFSNIDERKKIEQERDELFQQLQQTNALLDTLFDQAPIGFGFWDRNLRFARVNAALAEINGLPPEAHIGKTVAELLPGIDPGVMEAFHQVVEQGTPIINQEASGETLAAPGQKRYWSVSYYPIRLQDQIVGAGAICEEITTKKQVEEERKQFLQREQAARTEAEEARQRLHDLFMQAPALICILRGKEHIFELANPNFMQLIGNRDILWKPASAALPELVEQGFHTLLNQVYTTGETFVGNGIRALIDPHQNGMLEEGYFDFVYQPSRKASGEIDGVMVYAVNVTEQVRARQAMQASQQRLELAQQAARIGTFEWDITNNHVIWTPELEALHGLPPGTFEGTYEAWARCVHPDDLASVETNIQKAINGGPAYNAEFRIIRLDGSIRWLLGKGEIHRDDAQSPVRMIGINMDITERKELERRKDDFISMASHELKTPVTSIKGFTQVLLKRARRSGDEESLRFLTIMDTQLNKLTKLVSDLLDVSKMQSGKLTYREEHFDLDDLVRETVENIQAIVSTHQIQIKGRAHTSVPGDRDRIGQVLINLLTNAIKYSPRANTVIVRVAGDQKEAVVSVQDFGIGIAEAYHDKIFEQFYQVTDPEEKTYPGLGIGLYLSDEIVKRHTGRMWVESTKGTGSTFSFSLPLVRADEIA